MKISFLLSFMFLLLLLPVAAQEEQPIREEQPQGITPEQIVQRFAAKEKEFQEARENYTFRQTIKVQELDGSSVEGEFQEVSEINFDSKGKRVESVAFAPQSSLRRLDLTREDYEDLRQRAPFVLTTDDLPEYQVVYVGQQLVDEIDTYVFDVAPRTFAKGKRYFQGRVWVDKQDLQIVKSSGKPVGYAAKGQNKQEQQFPVYTSWREQIDGRYWFPTYVRAHETLKFPNGDIPMRIIIRYTDYKRFGSKTRITYEGEEIKKGPETPAEEPKKPQ